MLRVAAPVSANVASVMSEAVLPRDWLVVCARAVTAGWTTATATTIVPTRKANCLHMAPLPPAVEPETDGLGGEGLCWKPALWRNSASRDRSRYTGSRVRGLRAPAARR